MKLDNTEKWLIEQIEQMPVIDNFYIILFGSRRGPKRFLYL